MSKIHAISLSFILAGGATAADRPAVRMLPAKPMDPFDAMTARAASNSAFDPFADKARSEPPRRNVFDTTRDNDKPASPSTWTKLTKWVDERAKAVKTAVTRPEPQPEPRVGQTPATRRLFEPKQSENRDANKVSAANPAYRWYGWGTPVPGANQFAPTGDYPHGSAQWYTQTGATPGAFPVPTMNPYRPAPSTEPPTYIPQTVNVVPPTTNVVIPPPIYVAPMRQTIAETPGLSAPKTAPAMSAPFAPSNQVPLPPPPEVPAKNVAKPMEPAWRPVTATEPVRPAEGLIVPVIRGQEPEFGDSPLALKIRETGRGLVKNVVIRETGPSQLVITFDATTQTLSDIAVKAMSVIIELKPYSVEFNAKVSQ